MDEKLQKVLARVGVGSRREMEKWIQAGRVHVNGVLATLGDRVTASDKILVDGQPINSRYRKSSRTRILLYNKPEGEICSRSDPEGRPTVYANLPRLKGERWVAVGRLDYNTSGLMLFTTDGHLANNLMHPSNQIEREYAVRIKGKVDEVMLQRLQQGVMLEDGPARFADIQLARGEMSAANQWYYVVITEGRNREVRRLWESQGVVVSRLKRVRYGNVFMPSKVKAGQWMEMEGKDVLVVLEMAGLSDRVPAKLLPKEKQQLERRSRKLGRAGSWRGSKKQQVQRHPTRNRVVDDVFDKNTKDTKNSNKRKKSSRWPSKKSKIDPDKLR